jgi:hypothetical protein
LEPAWAGEIAIVESAELRAAAIASDLVILLDIGILLYERSPLSVKGSLPSFIERLKYRPLMVPIAGSYAKVVDGSSCAKAL